MQSDHHCTRAILKTGQTYTYHNLLHFYLINFQAKKVTRETNFYTTSLTDYKSTPRQLISNVHVFWHHYGNLVSGKKQTNNCTGYYNKLTFT